jgi:hypothetical protein
VLADGPNLAPAYTVAGQPKCAVTLSPDVALGSAIG